MDLTEALELDFEIVIKETDKAYQIHFSTLEIHWVPKSQCRILNNILYMLEWLVKEKGLEGFVLP
ncbi:MAG TPA: hypothetical protein DCX45_03460 [Acinetobacter junii]|nr:hypothetical protein [Acinetobacter junii]